MLPLDFFKNFISEDDIAIKKKNLILNWSACPPKKVHYICIYTHKISFLFPFSFILSPPPVPNVCLSRVTYIVNEDTLILAFLKFECLITEGNSAVLYSKAWMTPLNWLYFHFCPWSGIFKMQIATQTQTLIVLCESETHFRFCNPHQFI